MKCPKCSSIALVKQVRHGLEVESCPKCHGMFLECDELDKLEDQSFDDDAQKGSLMFSSVPTHHQCPKCEGKLKRFQYRLYDLTLEFCEWGDGFWMDANEESRVLDLMNQRKGDVQRTRDIEQDWRSTIRHFKSRSFFDKIRRFLS